jgi:hypothetical protein
LGDLSSGRLMDISQIMATGRIQHLTQWVLLHWSNVFHLLQLPADPKCVRGRQC